MPHESPRNGSPENGSPKPGSSEDRSSQVGRHHPGPSSEDFLRWEEDLYREDLGALDEEGFAQADESEEPLWFADLVDGRLAAEERRIREASLQENPDLQARYEAYVRTRESLVALGRSESGQMGGPFLRARILAAIQAASTQVASTQADGAGDPAVSGAGPAPIRRPGVFVALMASTGVAAAALLGLLYVLGQSPRKDTPGVQSVAREDGYLDRALTGAKPSIQGTSTQSGGAVAKIAPPAEKRGPADVVPARESQEWRDGKAAGEKGQTLRGGRSKNADKLTDLPKADKVAHLAKKGARVEELEVGDKPTGKESSRQTGRELAKMRKKAPMNLEQPRLETKSKRLDVDGSGSPVPAEVQAVYRLLLAEQQASPGAASGFGIGRGRRAASRARSKDKEGAAGTQMLLLAVEVDPQQAASLKPELSALETGRLWFSRTRAGLGMPSGGGGARPSSPSKDARNQGSLGSPATGSETGKAVAGNSGEADDDRGPPSGASPSATPKAHATERDGLAHGVQIGKMVRLSDLYPPEFLPNSSNYVQDRTDEVLILRGSRKQIQSTLTVLFSNSRRQALALVPSVSLIPVQAPPPGLAVPEGPAEVRKVEDEKAEDSSKLAKDGLAVSKGRSSNKKSQRKAQEKGAQEPQGGRDVPGKRRGKAGGQKARPSQKRMELKAKSTEPETEKLELRLLIRRVRHPVPGLRGKAPPATPSTPSPKRRESPKGRK